MRNWRKQILIFVVSLTFIIFAGCSDPYTAGAAGAGGGFALSETFKGAKADLQKREDILIESWNLGIEQGADIETLDQLQREIEGTRIAREITETGEKIWQVDWKDPQEAGSVVGLIATSILAYLNRRKLKTVLAGVQKFEGTQPPEIAGKLHDAIRSKSAKMPT